jgi:predicted dehydrogenase
MQGLIRAAVVGVGAFGRHHARVYHELREQGVELVGLVDIDPEGPRALADQYGVPLVSSVAALPVRPDVVSVAVPTSQHREVAEPLLRSGIHCLVEKPVAGCTRDARELVKASVAGSAHLQVGLVERFNPVAAALDRLGEPPVYIEVHRLAPWTGRATDVGVVMDMMIHDLDLLNHVVGEESSNVQAVGVSIASDHEDVVNARVIYPGGCVANVTASRVAEKRMRRVRVFGRGGYLRLDFDARQADLRRFPRRRPAWGQKVAGLAARGAVIDPGRVSGVRPRFEEQIQTERLPIGNGEPLRGEIEALLAGVREGISPRVGGPEGLRALALAERILTMVAADEGHQLAVQHA